MERMQILFDYGKCCVVGIVLLYDKYFNNCNNNRLLGIILLERSSQNCCFAAALLCYFYRRGTQVARSEVEAEKYERIACKSAKNYPEVIRCMSNVHHEDTHILKGIAYQYGWYFPKNAFTALFIFTQLESNPIALYQQALMFILLGNQGEGIQYAHSCLEKSANKGIGAAMAALGNALVSVPADTMLHKGFEWMKKAISNECFKTAVTTMPMYTTLPDVVSILKL